MSSGISLTYQRDVLSASRAGPSTIAPSESKPLAADLMNQTHLVSLVLQSKTALQQGEQLCTDAHDSSHASAQAAIDVLALDAKVKWVVDVVVEQLKVSLEKNYMCRN